VASSAAETQDEQKDGLPDWAKLAISGGIFAAVISCVFAVLVAFLAPELARNWQTHDKRIQVRTAIATEMSRSFTRAIGAGQRVGDGLIYGPTGDSTANAAVVQAEYNRGLGQWRIDSGRLAAELAARYPGDAIVGAWHLYTAAVVKFFRLGAGIPKSDRLRLVRELRDYLNRVRRHSPLPVIAAKDWHAMTRVAHFHKRADFHRAYDKTSEALLTLGDSFVQQELNLKKPVV
jgi:hypothetical protein